MSISRIFGVVLLVVGALLLFSGYQASQGVDDQVVEAFTGSFTDETMWYLIGGSASFIGGIFLTFFKKPLLD